MPTTNSLDTRRNAMQEALIEIWHADHQGRYDLDGYSTAPHWPFGAVPPAFLWQILVRVAEAIRP